MALESIDRPNTRTHCEQLREQTVRDAGDLIALIFLLKQRGECTLALDGSLASKMRELDQWRSIISTLSPSYEQTPE